ncbi:putative cell division protein YtgP [Jeotgalibaca dankookensis]|uniref:Putative cell division protein YtgP n=1 Tax=Jeotgalibaca dankookensis TaxID=708126 RepID=A0A1S6IP89_9LACT|nr:polysaccharide biosynthesis protein [Jeotgalibaca dankookensis]AQS53346.1 putative cell division protein YtgP [Jeotgalibaca dankookensis]
MPKDEIIQQKKALETTQVELPSDKEPRNNNDDGDKMVQGTFWMTFGSIFSRLLGALYIIPWTAMMGASSDMGNALFAIGYTPYQLFLAIGIAGFPSAMSKQIAQYNAKGEYGKGQELFKKSTLLMVITGLISAIIMFALAPIIGARSPGVSVEANALVIRSLAPALLIVPVMSLIRGYFQGYQNMVPSAITQVVEQLVRVAYILLATFIVMQVLNGQFPTAVAHSTFAAFVGAAASLVVLMWYYRKHMQKYGEMIAADTSGDNVNVKDAIKEMVRESIPFIIIGSGITFAKLIDQFTFEPIMLQTTNYNKEIISTLYGLFSFNADKLIMIIISLAVGMAATSIPLLVENYVKGNKRALGNQIRQIFELFSFVMFPAAFGMMVVSRPIYNVFYAISDVSPIGVRMLSIASMMAIILGAFTIVSSILQSFGKHTEAIIYLLIGLGVKLIIQYPLLAIFGSAGALYATSIGFIVTAVLSFIKVYRLVPFNVRETSKTIGLISLATGYMYIISHVTNRLLQVFITPDRKIFALLLVLIIAAVGGAVYIYLVLKLRIADKVLGERVGSLREKFKIK